jgi:hypothetical protein
MNDRLKTHFGRPHSCIECGAHFYCDDQHCDFAALSACTSCSKIFAPHSLMNEANRVARYLSAAPDSGFSEAQILSTNGTRTHEQTTTWV